MSGRRTRVPVSWLLTSCSAGVVIGVMCAHSFAIQVSGLGWILAAVLLGGACLAERRMWCVPLVMLVGVGIGVLRSTPVIRQGEFFAGRVGETVQLRGSVLEDAEQEQAELQAIRVRIEQVDGRLESGSLWVTVTQSADIWRSDTVTVRGEVSAGFGGFSASMYRAHLVSLERPEPGDRALRIRDWFSEQVRRGIDEPMASLGIGYLVGQKRTLPAHLQASLRATGLTHVVVASGYNLTILTRLARRLFARHSRFLAAGASTLLVICFIAVTGASPSMTRAGFVAGCSLAAWYYGRIIHPATLLSVAAAVSLLVEPRYGWGDLGWQLSFAAFAGVLIVAPLAQRFFFGETPPGVLRQILGETVAATALTAPILISAFGQISTVSVVANLLVLPFVPLAMLLTAIAGVAGWLLPVAAQVMGLPATWLLGFMCQVAEWLADLPVALVQVVAPGGLVLGYYVALGALCLYWWRRNSQTLGVFNIVA